MKASEVLRAAKPYLMSDAYRTGEAWICFAIRRAYLDNLCSRAEGEEAAWQVMHAVREMHQGAATVFTAMALRRELPPAVDGGSKSEAFWPIRDAWLEQLIVQMEVQEAAEA
jgi:hypothetical protein